jgi:hypothetical protein
MLTFQLYVHVVLEIYGQTTSILWWFSGCPLSTAAADKGVGMIFLKKGAR